MKFSSFQCNHFSCSKVLPSASHRSAHLRRRARRDLWFYIYLVDARLLSLLFYSLLFITLQWSWHITTISFTWKSQGGGLPRVENAPPRYHDEDHPREARTNCGHRCVSPHMIPRARETSCCILLTLFASYLSTNQSHVCFHGSGNFLFNQISFWQSYTWSNAVTDGRPNLCRIFRFQFTTIIFELSSQFQFLFVCRECLGLQVLIVLTFLSFRFSRTVLQGRNRQNPFHGQTSPVGVWSFLNSSSTRKKNVSIFESSCQKELHY